MEDGTRSVRRAGGGGADLLWPGFRAPSSAARASPASWETRHQAVVGAHSASAPTARPARATRRPTASWSVMGRDPAW